MGPGDNAFWVAAEKNHNKKGMVDENSVSVMETF